MNSGAKSVTLIFVRWCVLIPTPSLFAPVVAMIRWFGCSQSRRNRFLTRTAAVQRVDLGNVVDLWVAQGVDAIGTEGVTCSW